MFVCLFVCLFVSDPCQFHDFVCLQCVNILAFKILSV